MGTAPPADTDSLIQRARSGDVAAIDELLARHRDRLRRMVELRMDPRLAGRVDASDVVQEAIAEAARRMPDYLRQSPMPFYPWLRRLAWQRLLDLHRRHVVASRRSVLRERELEPLLPEQSARHLANVLARSASTPSGQLMRKEQRHRVQEALLRMEPHDREMLLLIYLEQMSMSEAGTELGISAKAAEMRHLRALERLRRVLTH
jgi:RNA polymerase sigma-70 factor, ECF subfamily